MSRVGRMLGPMGSREVRMMRSMRGFAAVELRVWIWAAALAWGAGVLSQSGCGQSRAGSPREAGASPAPGATVAANPAPERTSVDGTHSPVATSRAPRLLDARNAASVVPPDRLQRLLARNLDSQVSLPESLLASRLESW